MALVVILIKIQSTHGVGMRNLGNMFVFNLIITGHKRNCPSFLVWGNMISRWQWSVSNFKFFTTKSKSSWKHIVPTDPLRVFSFVRGNIPDAFFIPWGSLSTLKMKRPSVVMITQTSCLHHPATFGNKLLISQSWRKTLVLPARELMFSCRKGVVQCLMLPSHSHVGMSAHAQRHLPFFLCHATGEAFTTSPGSTGAMIRCAWNSPIQSWPGLPWQVKFFERDKKKFCVKLQIDSGLTPFMTGKTFTSEKDALWMWLTPVTSLTIIPNSFSDSITAMSTIWIFTWDLTL